MYLLRRNSAAVLAAFAFVLGACSSESAPTESQVPTTGDVGEDPLRIMITPGGMGFSSLTSTVPAPQTLAVSGLVAIGSAAQFGAVSYGESVQPWLQVDPTPTFRRDPLAWLHTVSINAAAYAALPNGIYTATVPVIVTAARNSPQVLGVALCKGTAACLVVGSSQSGGVTGASPSWNRSSAFNNAGPYYYTDYLLPIPANSTVTVTNEGSCSGNGTLSDPYLYAFELDNTFIASNDDGNGCLDSRMTIVNNGPGKVVRIRATTFGAGATGTFKVSAFSAVSSLRAEAPVPAEFAEILRQKAAGVTD